MGLTKQQLELLNNSSFPNNNAGYITPEILRNFNSSSIAATVNQDTYTTDSASFDTRIDNLETFSSSLVTNFATVAYVNSVSSSLVSTSSFNSYTQSTNNTIAGLTTTASFNTFTQSYQTDSASFNNRLNSVSTGSLVQSSSFNAYTASTDSRLNSLESKTGSYATTSSVNDLIAKTGSYATTGSNTFVGNQTINGNVSASSFVSASKFVGDGSQLTGITSSVAVTILDEGIFQGTATSLNFTGSGISAQVVAGIAVIQAQVDQTVLNQYTTTASFNSYTQSNDTKVNNLTNATASYALSSSVAAVDIAQDGKINSLTALTASTAYTNVNNSFAGTQSFNNVIVNGTASIAFLNVTYQSSSVVYSSGSNIFGDNANEDTQKLEGRVIATGSFEVTGSSRFNGNVSITGSANVNGSPIVVSSQTSSMAVSSSTYAVTASYAVNAQTASEARNLVIIARNGNQSTLGAGTVVRITSATGDNPIFNTASFDSETLSSNTLGILRNSTTSGADGEVVVNGIVLGVNTDPANGYVAGDVIYLSSSGQFTRVQPQAPLQTVTLGEVLRAQQNNGSIYVNVSNGWELNELHNVQINTPLTNNILAYESSSYGLWKNKSISQLGLATTGSNTFVGNQTITGSVIISSSAAVDLAVSGNIKAVDSLGYTNVQPNGITSLDNGTNYGAVIGPNNFGNLDNTTFDEIGLTIDATNYGISNWSLGPAMYVNNPSDAFPAVFGFQNKANYTDGRITALAPLVISGSLIQTGSTSFSELTGSLASFSASVSSRINNITGSGGTINTGSFATTGSNTFNGNQTINGNIKVVDQYGQISIARDVAGSGSQFGTINIYVDPITYALDGVFSGLQVQNAKDPNNLSTIIEMAANSFTPEYSTETVGYIGGGGLNVNSSNTAIIMRTGSANMEVFKPTIFNLGTSTTGSAVFTELTGSLAAFSASVDSRITNNSSSLALLSASFIAVSSSALTHATTGSNNFVGNQIITGSLILSSSAAVELQVIGALEITGSVAGNITALSVASSTASIDFSKGSFFTLTIPSSTITYITGSNLKPGMTANIVLTQQATTGSVRWESTLFKFPTGSINTGSAVASAVDMVSVAAVSSTTLYSVTARQLQ